MQYISVIQPGRFPLTENACKDRIATFARGNPHCLQCVNPLTNSPIIRVDDKDVVQCACGTPYIIGEV